MKPLYMTKEELYKSKGIGPSHVAAILHADPWQTAYGLWQIKTNRVPKPAQTAAMAYGKEKESEAVACFRKQLNLVSDFGQEQVIARHLDMPFLRGIADLWHEEGLLCQIKCPTSKKLLKQVQSGEMARNYILQLAAEMSIFGVREEFFFVYHGPDPVDNNLSVISLDDDFDGDTLESYWLEKAVPALQEFNHRLETDTWLNGDYVQPDEKEWKEAIGQRVSAQREIEKQESLKDAADSSLKLMLGTAKAASAAGWKAQWVSYKPSWEVSVKCDSREAMKKIYAVLNPLSTAEGVKEVKYNTRPDNLVFRVEEIEINGSNR